MSKWIKCSERKPDRGARVLVASYTGLIQNEAYIRIGVFDDYITGELLCFTENGYIMPTQPVLWKQLPVAPSWDAVKRGDTECG